MFFDATIEIKGIDRKGMILDVAKIITAELDINIHKVTVTADDGIFDGAIELRVHDRSDVKLIMERLKKIEGIQEVMRINWQTIAPLLYTRNSNNIVNPRKCNYTFGG